MPSSTRHASSQVDYEAELGVVIKDRISKITPGEACGHILGYTCANDVTARDLQKKDGQWTRAKSFDTFCPIGPWIETDLDPGDLLVESYLNGERKQSSRTSQLHLQRRPPRELYLPYHDALSRRPHHHRHARRHRAHAARATRWRSGSRESGALKNRVIADFGIADFGLKSGHYHGQLCISQSEIRNPKLKNGVILYMNQAPGHLHPVPFRRSARRQHVRQGHQDLQVREDQAGEARGPCRHIPGRSSSTSAWASPTRWPSRAWSKKLQKEAEKPENRGYADNGIPEFKEAAARYLAAVYKVRGIDPETEVLHGIGSKPVLAMFPAVFINPGDVTLMTAPGYPIMATHTRWYGGRCPDPAAARGERIPARP